MEAVILGMLTFGMVITEVVCDTIVKVNKKCGNMTLKRKTTYPDGAITEDEAHCEFPDVDDMMRVARVLQGVMGPQMRVTQN